MLKLLSIGNSFSWNSHYYLRDIAKEHGEDVYLRNLYIGGCSLLTHKKNLDENAAAYNWQLNGRSTSVSISIKDAVESDDWDIITLQQSSGSSFREETYEPYLGEIFSFVREKRPKAKILLHETWAYEIGKKEPVGPSLESQRDMFRLIRQNYEKFSEKYGVGYIPNGEVIQFVRENAEGFRYYLGEKSLNNDDGYHLNLYGKYLAGLCWFEYLFGRRAEKADFIPVFENEVADEKLVLTLNGSANRFFDGK